MASTANDFTSFRGASSGRKSPFQGVGHTAGSSSPYRFPKVPPLPNTSDISYDDANDPGVSQKDIVQVEEEAEPIVATIRTSLSDSGNEAGLSSDDDKRISKSSKSALRSRRRRTSLIERGELLGSVSPELVEPGRKLRGTPLRTRIVRILCWQLMLSTLLGLPLLLIADFIPFLNIITIPITSVFGLVLFFDLAFVAYLALAQTDPPESVTLPFLPWNPKLVWKVNCVLYRWLRVAIRVVPKLMRDCAIRRMLRSKRAGGDSDVSVKNVSYGSTRPGNCLDVYKATPKSRPTHPTDLQRPASPGRSTSRLFRPISTLPVPENGGPEGDIVLARSVSGEANVPSPVIVFFHSPQLGPITGKKWVYESLGRNLADMGYTVVIPDLTSYPEGKAKQMVQDVRRVLNWTMMNIAKYGGDPSQIHVMGHSLGGHLALLTILQEAVVVSRDSVHNPEIEMANGLRELKIYDHAVRLPEIQGLILLAPVCDVNDQIIQEASRGVAHLSKLRRILGPGHTRAMFHSPVHVLHAARNVIDLNLLPPKILFIHGGLDEEVPHLQSELMKEMIHGVGLPFVRCRIYPVGHVDVVTAYTEMEAPSPFAGALRAQQLGQPGQPGPGQPHEISGSVTNISGSSHGIVYRIDHRDSNTLLVAQISSGSTMKVKPGAMVAMESSVEIRGETKFSIRNIFTGAQLAESIFSGFGEVLIAPAIWGDIVPINVDGNTTWKIGRHAFLASSQEVLRTNKSQGFGKGLFSGEGIFVTEVTGQGILFVQSLGAITKRELRAGEEWVVDNGHLVAWTADYKIERIKGGGFISRSATEEGYVCRFTGPGTIYIQTRNPENLVEWIQAQMPPSRH
ncbi:hypothetical protein FRB90_011808 [Tulasnella sp. 427]|nr:hypothetical protein FRB90_011808 [Tulasnella sp. 427]